MILFACACILLYMLIGYVIGRVWYRAFSIRGDDLVMLSGVVAIFWPASLVLIPLLWYIVVPALIFIFTRLNRVVDFATDKVIRRREQT